MNKEFERCCTFLAEMIEKYGLDVLRDIADVYKRQVWGVGYRFNKNLSSGL